MLPEVREGRTLPTQRKLSRFFARFDGPGKNRRAFRTLWRWGHTRVGLKPCLQPLLAVLEERSNWSPSSGCAPATRPAPTTSWPSPSNGSSNLPRHLRRRLIRADRGFPCDPWLCLLESQGLRYLVVADLSDCVKSLFGPRNTLKKRERKCLNPSFLRHFACFAGLISAVADLLHSL